MIVTVLDNNGNVSTCTISVEVIGNDSDCDSIHDACDLCNGGDDTVDNNDDGLPDCAHPPAFADIIDDWKCGNNNSNVLVCHVPPGNPENAHTICISKDAVDVHVGNHGGDYLGECFYISCNQNKVVLENTELLIESVELFPNPASNYLNLMINETGVLENLQITDLNGRTKKLDGSTYTKGRNAIDITLLQKGIYFLSFELNKKIYVKRFIVIK